MAVHILLVEDDEVDIQDIQRTFRKNKISNPLHIARNGVEALNMLLGLNGEQKLFPTPQIILLDINMPKMNGIEFLKKMRSNPDLNSLHVFILTSSNAERDKMAAYKLDIAGYIVKPLQFSDFTQAISFFNLYWTLLDFAHKPE
ncbi:MULTISPECIES: response regulator [Legionella]|nr:MULTISPECIES: response regulator [Legionella]MCP0912945.1 response regulator [Legionella sp. 27cVA30]